MSQLKEDSVDYKHPTDRSKASSKPMTFQSETEWLFFHFWAKPTIFKFKIPDTVILDHETLIDNWYFTSA
jgi:hypothetical protein